MAKVGPAGGGRTEASVVPAGDHLVALVYFNHRTSRAGNPRLTCKWEVIAGPLKGRAFFAEMGLDVSKEVPRKIWEGYLTACGLTEAIELEGDEGKQNLLRYCKQVPVKARVKASEFQNRKQNEIQFFHYPSKLSPSDKTIIDAYRGRNGGSQSSSGGSEPTPDPAADDDFGPTDYDDTGADTDDIPF